VRELIGADRKSTALKELQALIWHDVRVGGEFVSPVLPDVARALRPWNEFGAHVAIYSSGSTAAQRDFFRYTGEGDLSARIGRYFDTRCAPKRDAESYKQKIAEAWRFSQTTSCSFQMKSQSDRRSLFPDLVLIIGTLTDELSIIDRVIRLEEEMNHGRSALLFHRDCRRRVQWPVGRCAIA
jgi:hypothetical protein